MPDKLKGSKRVQVHNIPLRAETMVFFKTTQGVLSDTNVRQALVRGADVPAIVKHFDYQPRLVREPFLLGQIGYDPHLSQASSNPAQANQILDKNGWKPGQDGFRTKGKLRLSFTLTALDTPDYHTVVKYLQQQWKQIGVDLKAQFLDPADFQSSLTYHDYDAILYGISVGSDPDVFVYWDSSQADIRSANRLNLSEYKNPTADVSLEAGRTRLDPKLRFIKYHPFLAAWKTNAPALALYQPRLLYLTNGLVSGIDRPAVTNFTDLLSNVQNWEIREAKVTN
jgi:peptide/nickel transport system substrate-binding protein